MELYMKRKQIGLLLVYELSGMSTEKEALSSF